MELKKQEYPEEGELLLCTVTKVGFHSVFCQLDEYGKTGMIHISEVSPGRIRNIRDFVVEGKKIVCKVLKISLEKGYIDLSLRRVTSTQQKNKINEVKKQQKVEKIIELIAKKFSLDRKKLYDQVAAEALKTHGSVHDFFEAVVADDKLLSRLKLSDNVHKELLEIIQSRIKEASVEIKGDLKLSTYDSNGIEVVKKSLALAHAAGKEHIKLFYEGGGTYKIVITAKNYKDAEKIIEEATNAPINFIKQHNGSGEFIRAAK